MNTTEGQHDTTAAETVAGYRAQPQWAIDAVNDFKVLEERFLRLIEAMETLPIDGRWMAIGRTQVQLGFMAVNRAIFQPGRVALPEDGQQLFDSLAD